MILFTDKLSASAEQALSALCGACSRTDGRRYGTPLDADFFYLFYEENMLCAALCIYRMGDTRGGLPIDECCAFTAPQHRQHGFFRALLQEALPRLSPLLRFVVPLPLTPECAAFLRKTGARHDHDEHMMALSLPAWLRHSDPAGGAARSSGASPLPHLSLAFFEENGMTTVSCRCGECALSVWGENRYLSGMLIYDRFRNQGYGFRFLSTLFGKLSAEGVSQVFLQVSSENAPALHLYQKLGFQITESVGNYYINISETA